MHSSELWWQWSIKLTTSCAQWRMLCCCHCASTMFVWRNTVLQMREEHTPLQPRRRLKHGKRPAPVNQGKLPPAEEANLYALVGLTRLTAAPSRITSKPSLVIKSRILFLKQIIWQASKLEQVISSSRAPRCTRTSSTLFSNTVEN